MKAHGTDVFKKLLKLHKVSQLRSLPTFKFTYSEKPTLGHVFRDYQAGKSKVQLTPVHSGVGNFSSEDFITSLVVHLHDPNSDPASRIHTPLIAWNIPASEGGLGQCQICLPPDLIENDVFVSPVCIGSNLAPLHLNRRKPPMLHTALKTGAAIGDIHSDTNSTRNAFVQFEGYTLILTWPKNHSNRLFFDPFHGTQHPLLLSRALDSMSGLQVAILRPGIGLVMDTGMYYGEMSPRTSATGGWAFVKAGSLRCQSNEILSSCLSEARIINSRMKKPRGLDDDPRSMINVMEYEVDMWRCLQENMTEKMHWTKELGDEEDAENLKNVENFLEVFSAAVPQIKPKRKRA